MFLKRGLLLVAAVLCLTWLIGGPSFAQAGLAPPPAEEATEIGIEALQLIALYDTQIVQVGSEAKVKVDGYTQTQFIVDYVAVKIYLQKWDGFNWVDVTYYPFENYFTDYVDGAYYYPVQRGYYYRTKGVHMARIGDTSEETTSHSTSIRIQ
ncbi:hypothetical protein SY88_03355 [Clostridiales bacterium PH28_bin88]|nr:hypothetical protein SY88_03355 [Clostridiales bacterium PH28_bin88]